MREVIASKLWIGHSGDLRDPPLLERTGIKALVHVALEEQLPTLSRELLYCHFPLVDGANRLKIVRAPLDLTVSLIRADIPTLVCCSNGMSRSPSILAGALAIVDGTAPADSLARLIHDQPHDVSPPLWDAVVQVVESRQQSDPA
jgi:protein-tyrosine phosphatase